MMKFPKQQGKACCEEGEGGGGGVVHLLGAPEEGKTIKWIVS